MVIISNGMFSQPIIPRTKAAAIALGIIQIIAIGKDLKSVKKIEQNLKESKIISLSRYCTIQRWKHGKRGDYVMLSMVWDINVEEDIGLVVCKPIDGFITV